MHVCPQIINNEQFYLYIEIPLHCFLWTNIVYGQFVVLKLSSNLHTYFRMQGYGSREAICRQQPFRSVNSVYRRRNSEDYNELNARDIYVHIKHIEFTKDMTNTAPITRCNTNEE